MFALGKLLDMCEVNSTSKLTFLPRFSMLLSYKAMDFVSLGFFAETQVKMAMLQLCCVNSGICFKALSSDYRSPFYVLFLPFCKPQKCFKFMFVCVCIVL